MTFSRLAGAVLVSALLLTGCTAQQDAPNALPSALPTTVVVPEGDIANQVSQEGNWSFSVTVADEKAQQAALDEMIAAGWEQTAANEQNHIYTLTRGTQNASVMFTEVEGKPAVVFNVIDTAGK